MMRPWYLARHGNIYVYLPNLIGTLVWHRAGHLVNSLGDRLSEIGLCTLRLLHLSATPLHLCHLLSRGVRHVNAHFCYHVSGFLSI